MLIAVLEFGLTTEPIPPFDKEPSSGSLQRFLELTSQNLDGGAKIGLTNFHEMAR
jgi:hypothetical protein